MPGTGEGHRLIQHHPVPHTVAKQAYAGCYIIAEPANNIPVRPPAFQLQRIGQVPVVQRYPGGYPQFQAQVNNSVVKVSPGLIQLAFAFGKKTTPGYGETIGRNAHAAHHHQIVHVTVVKVTGYITVFAIAYTAFGMGKYIPYRLAFTVFIRRPFYLVGSGRYSPIKIRAKIGAFNVW